MINRLVKSARNHKGNIEDFVEKHNLIKINTGHPNTRVWGNRLVIIKDIGIKVGRKIPSSAVETETVELRGKFFLIQPRVKPGDEEAFKILKKREKQWVRNDGAEDNCGWYRGKPVIIDW